MATRPPGPLTRSTAFLRLVSARVSSTKFSQRPRQSAGSPGRERRCEPGAGATVHGRGEPGADLKGCLPEGKEARAAKGPAGTRGAHGDRARPRQSRTAEETSPASFSAHRLTLRRPSPRVPACRTGQAPESHGPRPVTEDHGPELLAHASHPKLYPLWGVSPGHTPLVTGVSGLGSPPPAPRCFHPGGPPRASSAHLWPWATGPHRVQPMMRDEPRALPVPAPGAHT